MIYVSSPSSSDQSQPPTPFPWGAGEILPSTLNGRGLKVGRARVQRGGGFLLCPCLFPPSLALPSSHLFPLWRWKIFYFLLFITSDLGPLFVLPINLSDLRVRQTDAPQGWLDKDFYFLLHKNIKKIKIKKIKF